MKKKINPRFPLNYSLWKAILDILLDISEHATLFESPYKHIQRLHREALGIPTPPMWRYNRAMKYLEFRKKIKLSKEGNRLFIKLTKKGKLDALLARLEGKQSKRQGIWDRKWRIIIWDIPESSHLQRNKLRYFVKSLGFYQLQKSVFVRPYPIPGEAVAYLKESGLTKFIRFMRVDQFDDVKFLRAHFDLRVG